MEMYVYADSKQHVIWERCSEHLEHATRKRIQRRLQGTAECRMPGRDRTTKVEETFLKC